jgi:ribosomal-protein-serine acetyltransferase
MTFRRELSGGLVLRLPEASDAEVIFAIVDANRAYLSQWMSWVAASRGPADTLDWINKSRAGFADGGEFGATILLNDKPIGTVGLHHLDMVNVRGEIGYWLAESFQGRGIMTRACRALIDYAIRERQIHRLEIRCAPQNLRSRAVAQRLGFCEEAILKEAQKLGDRWLDNVVYAMLAQNWKARPPNA